MEDLQEIIGVNRALELSFSSREGQIETQLWTATLKQLEWGPDDEDGLSIEYVLATAELARVDLSGPWLDSLDAESASLEAVGGAFLDRGRLSQVDEDSQFADSLLIIDYVEVPEGQRGFHVSHCLVWGIAHIFRNDIIALTPARMTSGLASCESRRRT